MYAFLLVLGAVATAAGFALIASGVPINEFALGNTLIVAGTVSAIGGLIIVALGLAVRELQRIERALIARPMPRPARQAEPVAAPTVAVTPPTVAAAPAVVSAPEKAAAPARIPFPQRPKPEVRQPVETAAAAGPSPSAAEETAFERLRQKFPSLTRLESAPVVEANEVSLSPRTPARTEEYSSEVKSPAAPGRTNGTAPAQSAPRLEAAERPAPPPKGALFDSLWPKDARGVRHPEPHHGAEAAAVTAQAPAPPAVATIPRPADVHAISILKSGVVDGMAYTLYSDGSIEAQLPQGTMRFGSITDLRNHLERNG
jgi:hypothetical protein